MQLLPPRDEKHLEAAEGWLELGNHIAANDELERITPNLRSEPRVLEMRCRVYSKAGQWQSVLIISEAICALDPKHTLGWEHRAESLHQRGRTKEALTLITEVAETLTDPSRLFYKAAVYAAAIEDWQLARKCLERCFELDPTQQIRITALEDPKLSRLWQSE
jgi:tetratricopeptide (TPR) repeat protein